jgi:hypothetical protein
MREMTVDSGRIWRDSDNIPLLISGISYVPAYVRGDCAALDATGRWRPVEGTRRDVSEEWVLSARTLLPPVPTRVSLGSGSSMMRKYYEISVCSLYSCK